jgi:2-(1,2-epoxy-1,2-dihydrophenyl)acetyl-CoA isomerase
VGLARAKALMLLGEPFTARQAQDWGLVWQVVPDAELDAASWRVAERLAALDPAVAGRFKHVLNTLGLAHFEHAIDLENGAQRALMAAAGAAAATAAPASVDQPPSTAP